MTSMVIASRLYALIGMGKFEMRSEGVTCRHNSSSSSSSSSNEHLVSAGIIVAV